MSEQKILLLVEIIMGELFTQSRAFSDAADAPTVWMDNPDYMSIDGAINLRRLAMAIIRGCAS